MRFLFIRGVSHVFLKHIRYSCFYRLYIFSRIAKANNRHITDIISPAPTSQIPQLAHRYHYIKMYICVFTHIFKYTTYAHRLFAVNG